MKAKIYTQDYGTMVPVAIWPLLIVHLIFIAPLHSQNVGIGTTTPDASALLDIDANNKGLLAPRVAHTTSTDASTITSPATSLLVYNNGTGGLTPAGYYYNAGTPAAPNWVRLETTEEAWRTTGNAGTTAGSNFIGTTDSVDLVFRSNNTEKMRILSKGNVGIGTATPVASALLDLTSSNK